MHILPAINVVRLLRRCSAAGASRSVIAAVVIVVRAVVIDAMFGRKLSRSLVAEGGSRRQTSFNHRLDRVHLIIFDGCRRSSTTAAGSSSRVRVGECALRVLAAVVVLARHCTNRALLALGLGDGLDHRLAVLVCDDRATQRLDDDCEIHHRGVMAVRANLPVEHPEEAAHADVAAGQVVHRLQDFVDTILARHSSSGGELGVPRLELRVLRLELCDLRLELRVLRLEVCSMGENSVVEHLQLLELACQRPDERPLNRLSHRGQVAGDDRRRNGHRDRCDRCGRTTAARSGRSVDRRLGRRRCAARR